VAWTSSEYRSGNWSDGDFATGISATCDRYASEHRQRRPAPGGDARIGGREPTYRAQSGQRADPFVRVDDDSPTALSMSALL